jgi:hypothetical protein
VGAMTPPTLKRLVIELDHDGHSIAGIVRDTDGRRLDFIGWLGLAAAIEELAEAPASRS